MALPQSEARIIGKLLILQQTVEILPTREEQVAFIRRTLQEVPGLADVRFCLLGLWVPKCPGSNTACILADQGRLPLLAAAPPCCAADTLEVRSLPVRTTTKLYGFMILSVADPAALAYYSPYLVNAANSLANLLEKWAMGEELRKTFNELEHEVEARTAELAQKNALLEREIEQRKRAEAELQHAYGALERRIRERTAELQASEERLRAIITAAVDGIITISDRGLVELFNPAAERLFGYTAAEVLGRNITMLMPPAYRERHTAYLSRRLTPEETKYLGTEREILGLHKDGSTFPLEIAISETWIGGARKFTGILRDITERKRAEARIRDSEAFIRRVLDNLFAFVGVLLPDGTVLE
jgi:PAS domain S-box-containing protein